MNGINYSELMGNTLNSEIKFRGSFSNTSKKTTDKTAQSKSNSFDRDTYEFSGGAREVKAGYDRPKNMSVQQKKQQYKALDSEGIQEGVELSDAAQNLLKELREKYTNMDIYAAEWSTDEEQEYYASFSNKQYSVLINPEALEAMAADPEIRAKYESVLGGVEENYNTVKESLGEDADKVSGFSVTIDKDGKVSYALKLLKGIGEDNEANAQKIKEKREAEKLEEKRVEKKEAQEKRLEKLTQKQVAESEYVEKIEADSIEALIEAVKNRLYPTADEEKVTITEIQQQTEESVEMV